MAEQRRDIAGEHRAHGAGGDAASAPLAAGRRDLLVALCHAAPAQGGAIIRLPGPGPHGDASQGGEAGASTEAPIAPGNEPEVVCVHPEPRRGQSAPAWLSRAIESIRRAAPDRPRLAPMEGGDSYYGEGVASLALVPFTPTTAESPREVGAWLVRCEADEAPAVLRRLELGAGLFELLALRDTHARREAGLRRLGMAVEAAASLQDRRRLNAAAMALCNHVASLWRCDRASLGFPRGAYVRLRAISHTERLVRSSALVRDLEAAMEECLDQDVEIVHPAPLDDRRIARGAAELSARHGPAAVCSLPLRRGEEIIGALTVERSPDRPFDEPDVESLRLACDLCAAPLALLHEHDRWIGARIASEARRGVAALVGPRHAWLKLGAAAAVALGAFLAVGKGTYRVEGAFRLEASERRIVPAPFDGVIREVFVEVGDALPAGAPLARLDDSDLRLQLAAAQAELAAHQKEVAIAQRERREGEAQIARAEADKAAAEAALLERRIAQASMIAPAAGLVVVGDLKRMLGAPVKTGEPLFEVAPIESLRADVYVPEDQVVDLRVGQRGALAAAAHPELRTPIEVERIDPAASMRAGRNVFRVRARLLESSDWMRPGMEGVARIDAGSRRYAWIWTRRVVDWVRMRLWI